MRAILLGTVALMGGCMGADVLKLDSTPHPVVATEVPVLMDEPKESYRSIGLVEVQGAVSLEKLSKRLSAEAAKLGGQAVVITQRTHHNETGFIPTGNGILPIDLEDSRLYGKVIVYEQ